MDCGKPIATTITEVDPDDPEWVEKVAEITGAVSGDTYVNQDHGILTVNQIDMFLKAMPFELTYADEQPIPLLQQRSPRSRHHVR